MSRDIFVTGHVMHKPWLKLWHTLLDDEKVQQLSETLFKWWINLLVVALKHDHDGLLPSVQSVAFKVRSTPEQVASIIEKLVEVGLVEKNRNAYTMHDWDHWQSKGMSDSERQKRKRERDKDSHVTDHMTSNDDVTKESRDCHAPRGREEIDIEGEIEKEKEETPLPPKRGKRKTLPIASLTIPEHIPKEDWEGWLEVRRGKGKPLTYRAMVIALNKLEKLRASGIPAEKVLQAAILGAWTGLHDPDSFAKQNGHTSAFKAPKPLPAHPAGNAESSRLEMESLRASANQIDYRTEARLKHQEEQRRERERHEPNNVP